MLSAHTCQDRLLLKDLSQGRNCLHTVQLQYVYRVAYRKLFRKEKSSRRRSTLFCALRKSVRRRGHALPHAALVESYEPSFRDIVRGPGKDAERRDETALPRNTPEHWVSHLSSLSGGRKVDMRRLYNLVQRINDYEPGLLELSDKDLKDKTKQFRRQLKRGSNVDDLLPEAFAVVREASRRVLGLRHYDVQLIGGMVLHKGEIAEMKTGEGKTLVALLPAYLNALDGRGVHIVTVNDYLAQRDRQWVGKVLEFLGLSVASLLETDSQAAARIALEADVVYARASKLCFVYISDNVGISDAGKYAYQRPFHYAIVDEADSVLIDEARDPMILSESVAVPAEIAVWKHRIARKVVREKGPWEEGCKTYGKHAVAPSSVMKPVHFVADHVYQAVNLTRAGMKQASKFLREVLVEERRSKTRRGTLEESLAGHQAQQGSGAARRAVGAADDENSSSDFGQDVPVPEAATDLWSGADPWGPYILAALNAEYVLKRNVHYIVRDDKVMILDKATGRVRPVTRWQHKMHEAVEAKEGLEIGPALAPVGSITFQTFFRFYHKLAGMTGTAYTESQEFHDVYGLSVTIVPPHKPSRRIDHRPMLFADENGKASQLLSLLLDAQAKRRPVLLGTNSVQDSDNVCNLLSRGLQSVWEQDWRNGPFVPFRYQLLNARLEHFAQESRLIAQAGVPGCITVATGMAGRGTDIILGGQPKGLVSLELEHLILPRIVMGNSKEQSYTGVLERFLKTDLPDKLKQLVEAVVVRINTTSQDLSAQLSTGPAQEPSSPVSAQTVSIDEDVGPETLVLVEPLLCPHMSWQQGSQELEQAVERAEVLRARCLADCRHRGDFETIFPHVEEFCDKELGPIFMESKLKSPEQRLQHNRRLLDRLALYLWLYFDERCVKNALEARKAGGLLVICMGIVESLRNQLQLLGRCGRQGDPGETWQLIDLRDPIIVMVNNPQVYEVSMRLIEGQTRGLPLPPALPELLISMVQWELASQAKAARAEVMKYDDVKQTYRSHAYSLRRLLVMGFK
eukprot:jgi/Botrbrau1/117/Bobra.0022s0103.2